MSSVDDARARWWTTPLAAAAAALGTDARGLSAAEATARLARFGPNESGSPPRLRVLRQLARRFGNPLVLILLAAGAVAAATGDAKSSVLIAVIVALSVTLDFLQEYRAERAAAALRARVATRATILRDGRPIERPVREVVPGDVVVLAAGDLVPADGRLLEARDCFVTEALLTGEPYPVEKHVRADGEALDEPRDARGVLFAGTSLISGSARLLVCATGRATQLGAIVASLAVRRPPTAFEVGARRFGLLITRLTVLLVLFVLLVNAAYGRPWLESFLFAVALAVGLTPELLPMIVSITLANGALRMAQRRVIVKHLPAIQNLGSMDVLCTDKTGTLTEARIELERHVDPDGCDSRRVLALAWLNSRHETGLRSPLDDAILRHDEVADEHWSKIDEVPFGFERRRVSVLVERDGERLLIVKGAPEDVLALSTSQESGAGGGAPQPLDDAARAALERTRAALAAAGLRTLGIGWRRVAPDHHHAVVDDETELVFAGWCAFLDPPKASAGDAIRALARDGVSVRIVTGDEELVARHVCAALGIAVEAVLTGADVAALDEAALASRAERTTLFCRVAPAQKQRVIRALQRRGHVVGYVGDGINDAPSLHVADAGVSVDGAVDVAREAADFIMLDHDLGVLHAGVLEGRRTYGNLQKYLLMGTSSNFGNMFSMAGAALFLPFLPMLPTQILLNNLLYDLSEIPVPFDSVDEAELARPRVWDVNLVRDFMIAIGPVSSVFDFLTFGVLLVGFHASAATFQTGWFVESLTTQALVIFVIRTRGSPFASRPQRALAWTALAVVAAGWLLPATPLGRWFGLVPLPPSLYAAVALLAGAYLVLAECVKRAFYRARERRAAAAR